MPKSEPPHVLPAASTGSSQLLLHVYQGLCSFSLSSHSRSTQFGFSPLQWLCTHRTAHHPKSFIHAYMSDPAQSLLHRHLLDTLLAVQCIWVYRLYSLGSAYSFLSGTMMFWAKSFQFSLSFTVWFIKNKSWYCRQSSMGKILLPKINPSCSS